MPRSRRRALVGLLSIALTALSACGDGGAEPISVVGTYSLRSVNGDDLPAAVSQGPTSRLDVTAGSMKINADGTYFASISVRVTAEGAATVVPFPEEGTYTRQGDRVTFTASYGDVAIATLRGSALTVVESDPQLGTLTFRYVKD